LNIEINIQSRNANIEIIDGKFKDKNLTQLTKNQVEELLSELKTYDIRGFNILNLLINQSFQNSQSSSSSGSMTEEEALSILGLEKGADDEEIRKSYYNLMKKFHPDKDGNNYLSNLITEAKNKLLKQ
jgi:DnaJ-domain-containing protein 1